MERSQEYEPLILDLQKSQAIPQTKRSWLIVLFTIVAVGGVIAAIAGVNYMISSFDGRKTPTPENTPVAQATPTLTPTMQASPSPLPMVSDVPTPRIAPVASPTPVRQAVKPTPTTTRTPAPLAPPVSTEPAMGFLTLNSAPEQAEVRIDGKLLGYTPLKHYALAPGTYTVKFVYQGKTSEKKLTITAGKTTEYAYSFNGLAELEVRTIPRGCDILLNGESAGQSPLTRNDLLPGTYTVTARKPGYASADKTVTLERGQPQSILLMLKRLDFVTDPGSSSSSTPRPLHPSERQ